MRALMGIRVVPRASSSSLVDEFLYFMVHGLWCVETGLARMAESKRRR
jgi:hypothetical protein